MFTRRPGMLEKGEDANPIASSKTREKLGNDEFTEHTFSTKGGRAVVRENSPWADGAHSITNFHVDEDKRGQRIGHRLVGAVKKHYKGSPLSGQVSSLASLKVLHNHGFRPLDHPDASFEESKKHFDDNVGSLNMRLHEGSD
jgi:hypothetical protein